MQRRAIVLGGATFAGLVAAMLLVAGVPAVFTESAPAQVVDKVTLCHRTNSNTNPYVVVTPDVSGVINGHADHTGPVWDPSLKADHIKWGDIIPPFDYGDPNAPTHFAGLNWDSAGQDIYYGNTAHSGPAVCATPTPPEQQYGSLSVVKVVKGLPLAGAPVGGSVPTSFSAHVSCDDGHEQDVTFPVTGGAGAPAVVDHIEAGSKCSVSEAGTASFPLGTTVSHTPAGIDSPLPDGGAFVDANTELHVTITNDFTGVQVSPEVVTPTPSPVVVAPALTG